MNGVHLFSLVKRTSRNATRSPCGVNDVDSDVFVVV